MSAYESRPPKEAAPESPAKKTALSVVPSTAKTAAAHADPFWWAGAWTYLLMQAASGRTFTVDSFRLDLPAADHPCRWGALMAAGLRAGLIEPVGATVSGVDGRLTRVWCGLQGGDVR